MREKKTFFCITGGGAFKCDESCLKNDVEILARDNVERKKSVASFVRTATHVLLKK
jgi:hypothetical protein